MGVAVFLRKRMIVNKFRELLINAIDTGLGDNAIICSGFFQEFFNSTYCVSREGNLDTVLLRNKIKLTTVGVYSHYWKNSYKLFRDNLRNIGININAKLSRKLRWHAKIFILLKGSRPIFAIIGSSNMTRSAFGISAPFNFESDVVLWLDEFTELNNLVYGAINELIEFPSDVIVSDYNKEKNNNYSLEDKLGLLIKDIEETVLIDLE